jgi:Winged helix-turn helix
LKKKFVVRLSVEERSQLESLVAKGNAAARKFTRARILLKADCSGLGPAWTDQQMSKALDLGAIAVHRVRRSFVEGGLDAAVVRRRLQRRPRMLDDEQEAHLIALGVTDTHRSPRLVARSSSTTAAANHNYYNY